jgi:transposase-like protein
MKKQRKHYTPEEKAAILRRHLVEGMPISGLCDELGSSRRCSTVGRRVLRERSRGFPTERPT